MVRCSKCGLTVGHPYSESWDYKMCPMCWFRTDPVPYEPEKLRDRKFSTPFDFYLDYWTLKEIIRAEHWRHAVIE